MKVSLNEIKEILNDLIEEKKSREQVAFWALKRQFENDMNNLEFEPLKEKKRIWRVISYLTGVDLLDMDGSYLHSLENFIDFRKEVGLDKFAFFLHDLKEMMKSKLNEFIGLEHKVLSQVNSVKEIADDLGSHWLMCPLCQESWENHEEGLMIICPKCNQNLYNPHAKNTMGWNAESEALKPRRYEIKYFPALGYYLYVFENDVRLYDYFYDTWEAAIDYAWKEFGVSKDSWKKDE